MSLLLLLISTISEAQNSCESFVCSSIPSTESICISNSSSTTSQVMSITSCIPGLECLHSSPDTHTCEYPKKSLPGDYCNSNNQCESNLCSLGKCEGRYYSSPCLTSADCDVYLYCDEHTFTCVDQLSFGSFCNYTHQCLNNLACDGKKCVNYFSLPIGSTVYDVPNYGFSYACTTGFAYKNTCAQPPVSNSTNPIKCEIGSFCISHDGKYSKPCICGYDGNGYCPLFEGDFALQDSISNISNILPFIEKCHTFSRFSYNCYFGYGALNLFLPWKATADLYFNNDWVKRINNSACVNSTLTASYWNVVSPRPVYPLICPAHVCINNTSNWIPNQCLYYESFIVYSSIENTNFINQCPGGFICDTHPTAGSNATCIANKTLSNPGEFCINDLQCSTLNCTNNICIGLSANESCFTPLSCNPGFYCDIGKSHKCLKTKEIGESCSFNGPKCALGLQCSNNNICILYYTLEPGQQSAGASTNEIDYSCKSGFSYLESPSYIYICAKPPVTGPLTNCNTSWGCYDSTGTYNHNCACPFNGYMKCAQFQGDYSLTTAIMAFNNTYPDWKQCNTGELTYRCFLGNLTQLYNYAIYWTNMTVYIYSPKLDNYSRDCISETYFPEYWFLMDIINNYNPNPPIPPQPEHICAGYLEYPSYPEYPQYPWNKNEYPEYPEYLGYPKYPQYSENCTNTVMLPYPMYPAYPEYPAYLPD
ncbi:hypothetical protein SteCoe_25108 [Stentor coeruleus]|uniref:Uncharacterized protein n=1 Tax=Stentor coeruleus TaxID=5963 RepID=A0A1R2BG34_9CILI|nr:hypothetical protein SteCoe_25108 [Stentor coeruleus]